MSTKTYRVNFLRIEFKLHLFDYIVDKFRISNLYFWKKQKKTEMDNKSVSQVDPENNEVIGISLRNLTKIYHGKGGKTKVAVRDLSLDFRAGEVTALLGHNGAGKSTTM